MKKSRHLVVAASVVLFVVLAVGMWYQRHQRRLDPSLVTAAHLKSIGVALHYYATERNGAFPPDLLVLVDQGLVAPGLLVSPSHAKAPPGTSRAFHYIPGRRRGDDPEGLMAYPPPEKSAFPNGQIPVLVATGEVRFVSFEELKVMMEQAGRNQATMPAGQ